jgi:hypothetical protein
MPLRNRDGSLNDDSILYKYADGDYLLMAAENDHDAHFESLRDQLDIIRDPVPLRQAE